MNLDTCREHLTKIFPEESAWAVTAPLRPKRSATASLQRAATSATGFTLVELLVVFAIVGVLCGLLLPALSHAKSRAQSTACRNNLKQLQLAWEMYADANGGRIVLNQEGFLAGDFLTVTGWVTGNAQTDTSDENLRRGLLWDYLPASPVYHCPSDHSKSTRRPFPVRFRSYSLDSKLNVQFLPGHGGTLLPWVLRRDFDSLGPANIFGFLDESEITIQTALCYQGVQNPDIRHPAFYWDGLPAERHDRGANFSFLDGHVEYHRWLFTPKFHPGYRLQNDNPPANAKDRDDIQWYYDHTPWRAWAEQR